MHGVISLDIAKCKDHWVEWRPLQQRAEMILDLTLRGLLRPKKKGNANHASSGAPESVSRQGAVGRDAHRHRVLGRFDRRAVGVVLRFTTATSNLIDHSGADLWITSKNVPYVEQGVAFSERKLNQVRAVEGVADAQKIIAHWTQWKRHDGGQESVQIVGINVMIRWSGLGIWSRAAWRT